MDRDNLREEIKSAIKQNGIKAITAPITQNVLLNMVDNTLMPEDAKNGVISAGSGSIVFGKAVYDYTLRAVNTIAELRTIQGEEGQKVNLLGYYEAGDKPVLMYKWVAREGVDDGGSVIIGVGGYWSALFGDSVDVRDFGIKDGDNITNTINYLFSLEKEIIIPYFKLKLDADLSVNFTSNSKVVFNNTILEVIPTNQGLYKCLNFEKVENVEIKGHVKIIGDRFSHIGTTGEWGMGIYMRSSKNIYIQSVECSEMWGDGAYFGKTNIGETNNNIVIDNYIAKRNRRQGISFITGDSVIINKAHITDTEGALPQAGIDFEPNDKEDVLKNIVINNLYTRNNTWAGVTFDFQKLNFESTPVDIVINKHTSEYEEAIKYNGGSEAQGLVKGKIVVNNLYSLEAPTYAVNIRRNINYPDIIFNDPIIIDPNMSGSTDESVSCFSVYMIGNDAGFENDESVNFTNITIENPKFFKIKSTVKYGLVVRNFTATLRKKINSVTILNPFIYGFETPTMYDSDNENFMYNKSIFYFQNGYYELSRTNLNYWKSVFSNKHTTELNTVGLGNNNGSSLKKFVVESNNYLKLNFTNNKGYILGFNEINSSSQSFLQSNKIGSFLVIKCIDITNNIWILVDGYGEWEGFNGQKYNINLSKKVNNADTLNAGVVKKAKSIDSDKTLDNLILSLKEAGIIE